MISFQNHTDVDHTVLFYTLIENEFPIWFVSAWLSKKSINYMATKFERVILKLIQTNSNYTVKFIPHVKSISVNNTTNK